MTDAYYVSPFQGARELQMRSNLKKEVERFWESNGVEFPHELRQLSRVAALGRSVATFRFEDALFTTMAESAGLRPTWLTYVDDKFVTKSAVKRSLLKPTLIQRFDKHGRPITRNYSLVPRMDNWSMKPLSTVTTIELEPLTQWHRKRLLTAVPEAPILDMSQECRQWGGRAMHYYEGYLSLFIAHGVLFEDYHGGESGNELHGFTAQKFEPAVASLERRFGVKPLVASLPWWNELSFYPDGELLDSWRSCPILQREAA